jgi:hypothetical protein
MALLVPGAWCQGSLARNKFNAPVPVKSPEACQWCAIGAVDAVVLERKLRYSTMSELYNRLDAIEAYNDDGNRTPTQVARRLYTMAQEFRNGDA